MAMPPPPTPAYRGPEPPPPHLAQQLVARSGFVLYEGGRSVFDESVLVYLARRRSSWPNCDITDHVGRPLGLVRRQGRRRAWLGVGPTSVFDPGGAELLTVTQRTALFSWNFDIEGVATARYRSGPLATRETIIEANNERFGYLRSGRAVLGMTAAKIDILDQDRNPVGAIRSYSAGSSLNNWDHYVMFIEPRVRGEFRRLLVAGPLVAALMKRVQKSQG